MKLMRFVIVPAILFAMAAAADDGASKADKGATSTLVDALHKFGSGAGWVVTGSASEEEGAASSSGGAIIFTGDGSDSKRFSGKFEAHRTDKGELIITSKSALPGVAIYQKDERLIVSTTREDAPVTTNNLEADLTSVLDVDRLAKSVEKAKLEGKTDATSGETTFKGELPAKLIRATSSGGIGMITPKVMKVKVEFTLTAAGQLHAAKIGVVRSDPLAGLRSRAMSGGVQNGTVTLGADDLDSSSDAEGKTAVYEIEASTSGPSNRTKDALAAMRKVLENEAH